MNDLVAQFDFIIGLTISFDAIKNSIGYKHDMIMHVISCYDMKCDAPAPCDNRYNIIASIV